MYCRIIQCNYLHFIVIIVISDEKKTEGKTLNNLRALKLVIGKNVCVTSLNSTTFQLRPAQDREDGYQMCMLLKSREVVQHAVAYKGLVMPGPTP